MSPVNSIAGFSLTAPFPVHRSFPLLRANGLISCSLRCNARTSSMGASNRLLLRRKVNSEPQRPVEPWTEDSIHLARNLARNKSFSSSLVVVEHGSSPEAVLCQRDPFSSGLLKSTSACWNFGSNDVSCSCAPGNAVILSTFIPSLERPPHPCCYSYKSVSWTICPILF